MSSRKAAKRSKERQKILCLARVITLVVLAFCNIFHVPPAFAEQEEKSSLFPSPIKKENLLKIAVTYNDITVATVDGYGHFSGTLISANDLMKVLGFESRLDISEKRLYGKDPQGRVFILSAGSSSLTLNTDLHPISNQSIYLSDKDIFVDLTFFIRYFDIALSYASLSSKLAITSKIPRLEELTRIATGAPKKPGEPSTSQETEGQPPADAEVFVPKTIGAFEPTLDSLLSFEVEINRLIYDGLVDVYQHNDIYFLSLKQLAEAVEFVIKINPDTGVAEGWFIAEGNEFSLDVNAREARVRGEIFALGENEAFSFNDDIFVESGRVNQWFPLNMEVLFNRQSISMKPDILLPFQARVEREKKRAQWSERQHSKEVFPPLNSPYGFGWPMLDLSINSLYNVPDGQKPTFSPSYSGLTSGDLGLLNAKAFFAGNEDEVTSLRVTGERTDIDGNLPLGLTSFSVGDVSSVDTDLVAGTSLGRGISFTNYPLERSTQFDTTTINGDNLPGWEVELYSNGTLIDFQVVGNDGRYEFTDVPIFYGDNVIRLVFYGPNGEIREEEKTYQVDSSFAKKGDFHFRFSGTERNTSLLNVGTASRENGRTRFTGEAEYGLTDGVTLTSGLTHSQLDDESEHTYQTLGVSTAIADVVTHINSAIDYSTGGWALQMIANTKINDIGIRGEQRIFDQDFVSELSEGASDPTQSLSTLDINGNFSVPYLPGLNYRLTTQHRRFVSEHNTTSLTSRLGTSYDGIGLTSTTTAEFDKTKTSSSMDIDGTFQARGRINDISVRADLGYDIEPETQLQDVRIALQRKLGEDFDGSLSVRKQFTGLRTTTLTGLLNWTHKYYRLSNQLNIDSESNFSITTNLSMSFYQDPRSSEWSATNSSIAGSGGVSTIAFLDANYNNILDEGEEILEEVTFKKGTKGQESGPDGSAIFTGIGDRSRTNFSVDESTLESPLWSSAVKGYSILGRAGVIQKINFPIVETSEIDGTAYYINKDGVEQTVSGITLYLITTDGRKVGEAKTEFDGLYVFSKVIPGEYLIVVTETDLATLGVKPEAETRVVVSMGSDIYSGNDLILRYAPVPTEIPPTLAENKDKEEEPPQETAWTPEVKAVQLAQETPAPELQKDAPPRDYATYVQRKIDQAQHLAAIAAEALPESRYSQYAMELPDKLLPNDLQALADYSSRRRFHASITTYPGAFDLAGRIMRLPPSLSDRAVTGSTHGLPSSRYEGVIVAIPLRDANETIQTFEALLSSRTLSRGSLENYRVDGMSETAILPHSAISKHNLSVQESLGLQKRTLLPTLPSENIISSVIERRMHIATINTDRKFPGQNVTLPPIRRTSSKKEALPAGSRTENVMPLEYIAQRQRTLEDMKPHTLHNNREKSVLIRDVDQELAQDIPRFPSGNASVPAATPHKRSHPSILNNRESTTRRSTGSFDELQGYLERRSSIKN